MHHFWRVIQLFRDWFDCIFDIGSIIETAGYYIKLAAVWVYDWAMSNETLRDSFDKVMTYIQPAIDAVKEWVKGLQETDNIPKYIIEGLVNGLKSGAKAVAEKAIELGKSLLQGIKNILGIHSPSTAFFEIGLNIIQGLINGIVSGAGKVFTAVRKFGAGIIEAFKATDVTAFTAGVGDFFINIFNNIKDILSNVDWGSLTALGISIGLVLAVKKIGDALELLAKPLDIIGDLTEHIVAQCTIFGGSFNHYI